jgi:hypothetical protein
MSLCPTCGARIDDAVGTNTYDSSAVGVTISAQDFKFLFDAFETLTSPYSSNDQLAEVIKTEDDIWAWLKQIKNGHPSASLVPNTTD